MSAVQDDNLLQFETEVLQLRVVLVREDDGEFSAIARDLPGVASQGETIDEAITNIREAFRGAIEYYRDHSIAIPWQSDHFEVPSDAQERWILVDA